MAESDNHKRADRILDAAAKLIQHFGYDKTTVSDIANEAGVSKGAIYLHWSSKDDLFEALIFRESLRVMDDMTRRIENDPDGGLIFSLYRHGLLALVANPLLHAISTRDVQVLGDFVKRWNTTGLNEESNFFRLEMVQELQAKGVLRADADADVVAYILTLIRYGFLTVHDVVPDDKTPSLERVGEVLADMLHRALAPEGGSNTEAGKAVIRHVISMMRTVLTDYQAKMQNTKSV